MDSRLPLRFRPVPMFPSGFEVIQRSPRLTRPCWFGVTYGRELSDKFTRDCRALMTALWRWLADYLSELAAFPRGRHDDQVEFDGAGARLAEAIVDDGHDRFLAGRWRRRGAGCAGMGTVSHSLRSCRDLAANPLSNRMGFGRSGSVRGSLRRSFERQSGRTAVCDLCSRRAFLAGVVSLFAGSGHGGLRGVSSVGFLLLASDIRSGGRFLDVRQAPILTRC